MKTAKEWKKIYPDGAVINELGIQAIQRDAWEQGRNDQHAYERAEQDYFDSCGRWPEPPEPKFQGDQ